MTGNLVAFFDNHITGNTHGCYRGRLIEIRDTDIFNEIERLGLHKDDLTVLDLDHVLKRVLVRKYVRIEDYLN